ncbi:hypothetical protein C2U70_22130 [Bradyrhizobium guangdongense]|uniref:hypothetical protein n=1 Tax=Bradyrhizobium guangdongense TaxID=1325090 RepID=UPI00112E0FA6|nr:hypothetical protein [Bradyrhizobium guangdongense]TPQ32416.1 hypothetical protein C2U70_22130 [Bradyrhizobium guangdongense]
MLLSMGSSRPIYRRVTSRFMRPLLGWMARLANLPIDAWNNAISSIPYTANIINILIASLVISKSSAADLDRAPFIQ